jgi:predicted dehydrogenase
LTFNHQRRFGAPFRAARDLLRAGARHIAAHGSDVRQSVRLGNALVRYAVLLQR